MAPCRIADGKVRVLPRYLNLFPVSALRETRFNLHPTPLSHFGPPALPGRRLLFVSRPEAVLSCRPTVLERMGPLSFQIWSINFVRLATDPKLGPFSNVLQKKH